jgi:hypothetical protein
LTVIVPDDGDLPEHEVAHVWEVRRLMAGGVVERPCEYAHHAGSVWFGEGGHPRCGVCHPPAR